MDFDASVTPRPRARNRIFPKGFEFGRRKAPSFTPSSSSNSSSSSSSQCFPDDPPRSPLSPSTSPRSSSGVPFSWEKLPGIPKRQRNDSAAAAASLKLIKLLPLPPSAPKHANPAAEGGSFRKKSSPEWDPFTAALVECSKDDSSRHHDHREDLGRSLWTGAKVTRSISDRFGFISLYGSCKRTPAVDESVAHVPRPSRMTANPYGLIKYHRHGSIDK